MKRAKQPTGRSLERFGFSSKVQRVKDNVNETEQPCCSSTAELLCNINTVAQPMENTADNETSNITSHKNKKERKFQESWKKKWQWVNYNGKEMFCDVCRKWPILT